MLPKKLYWIKFHACSGLNKAAEAMQGAEEETEGEEVCLKLENIISVIMYNRF